MGGELGCVFGQSLDDSALSQGRTLSRAPAFGALTAPGCSLSNPAAAGSLSEPHSSQP